MKVCPTCDTKKPLDEFHRYAKSPDGHQRICKSCRKEFDRAQYQERTKEQREAYQARASQLCKERAEFLLKYLLEHPCIDCGEADPVVLQFDHVRDVKFREVTAMLSYSLQRIMEEIAKCEVRCANCHKRKTSRLAGHFRHTALVV